MIMILQILLLKSIIEKKKKKKTEDISSEVKKCLPKQSKTRPSLFLQVNTNEDFDSTGEGAAKIFNKAILLQTLGQLAERQDQSLFITSSTKHKNHNLYMIRFDTFEFNITLIWWQVPQHTNQKHIYKQTSVQTKFLYTLSFDCQ